ncbi:MAG: DNA polymerase domain-containing protein [Terriglobales bacterium]
MPKSPRRQGPLHLPPHARQALVVMDQHPVNLSHLDKTWFPDGTTKRDLLDYTHDVAPFLLPYLRDRPYTLKRFPNGILAPPFFQKEAGRVPAWMRTVAMPSANQRQVVHYILCNDTATLLYLVNLGCIDHNAWISRAATPLEPDFVLLDLDPGPKASFAAVVRVAHCIRALMEECEIAGYPKTSGATGIHIWIPISPGHTFAQSQRLAQLLLRLASRRVPELVTEVWRVAARPPERVYLDFRQNAHGKTIPPPYSPRPRQGAPVSCPLRWSELRPSLDPARFTIRTLRRRLDRFGDLFAPMLPGPHHATIRSMLARLERCHHAAA